MGHPSGLVDLPRSQHVAGIFTLSRYQSLEIAVDGDRIIRVSKAATAVVIIGMHRSKAHSMGLKCIDSSLKVLSALGQLRGKSTLVQLGTY